MVNVNARQVSVLKMAARITLCNSNLETISFFPCKKISHNRVLQRLNDLFVSVSLGKEVFGALKKPTKNIFKVIAKHVEFLMLERSWKKLHGFEIVGSCGRLAHYEKPNQLCLWVQYLVISMLFTDMLNFVKYSHPRLKVLEDELGCKP